MSTWGLSNFENETANSFIADLEINGYGLINVAFEKILDETERATVTECEEALIAAEIVAAVNGQAAHDFPEDAAEWVLTILAPGSPENQEIANLSEKAADIIDKIVTDSELKDLWEDNPEYNTWFQAQVDLQKRILD
jgi:hypothetical protein